MGPPVAAPVLTATSPEAPALLVPVARVALPLKVWAGPVARARSPEAAMELEPVLRPIAPESPGASADATVTGPGDSGAMGLSTGSSSLAASGDLALATGPAQTTSGKA